MRMMPLILTLLALLAPLVVHAADVGEKYTLTHDKREREYYLYSPSDSDANALPLVVVLHGGAGSPANAAKMTGFSELAKKEGFMVAYPAGVGHIPTWNAGRCCGYAERRNVDDVGFIEKMIADIKSRRNIDNSRIYATGMSNGGMMTYRLACELGHVFAAAAPVAGAMNVFDCKPKGRPSMFIVHGLDDKHVLYNGGIPQEGLRAMASHKPEADRSVGEALQFWLKADYCRKFPSVEDFGEVARVTYFCAEDRHVVLNTVDTGGHSWPGGEKGRVFADTPNQSFDATKDIWEFFKHHPPSEVF